MSAAEPACPDASASPWLRASAGVLAKVYDVALLDLDGVVYLGGQPVTHAAAALATARDLGMRLAFVTNNASRTPAMVAELLGRLGVDAAPSDVVTSAQAAARLLAATLPPGSRVLMVGGRGLHEALLERGLEPVRSAEDEPRAVVQGFAPEVDWHMLAEAAIAVGRGLPWVATNADLTVPTPRGTAPGNGALVQTISTATGVTPTVAGKPRPPLHAETVERTGSRHPLVVGDRLDTDIEGAANVGCDSLLVLTGVTTEALLLGAGPAHRPTYLARDLRGLLAAADGVQAIDDGFRAGAWVAVGTSTRAALTRTGADASDPQADRLDAVRALCALSWSLMDRGRDPLPDTVLEQIGRL